MNIQKCTNGHFYDTDKYSGCPHCNPRTPLTNSGAVGGGQTAKNPKDDKTVGWYDYDFVESEPKNKQNESGAWSPFAEIPEFPIKDENKIKPERKINQDESTQSVFGMIEEHHDKEPNRKPAVEEYTDIFSHSDPFAAKEDMKYCDLKSNIESVTKNAGDKTIGVFALKNNNMYDKPESTVPQNASIDPVAGWLVCVKGIHLGGSFAVYGRKNSVGRRDTNNIVIPLDTSISRDNHAYVTYYNNQFYLEPGQSNIELNGELLLTPQKLKIYDVIGLGNAKFVFIPLCGDNFDWKDYIN